MKHVEHELSNRDAALYWRTKTGKPRYARIGREEGLGGVKLKVYEKFMAKRFPKGVGVQYAVEWARRFSGGDWKANADTLSANIIKKLSGKQKW